MSAGFSTPHLIREPTEKQRTNYPSQMHEGPVTTASGS